MVQISLNQGNLQYVMVMAVRTYHLGLSKPSWLILCVKLTLEATVDSLPAFTSMTNYIHLWLLLYYCITRECPLRNATALHYTTPLHARGLVASMSGFLCHGYFTTRHCPWWLLHRSLSRIFRPHVTQNCDLYQAP